MQTPVPSVQDHQKDERLQWPESPNSMENKGLIAIEAEFSKWPLNHWNPCKTVASPNDFQPNDWIFEVRVWCTLNSARFEKGMLLHYHLAYASNCGIPELLSLFHSFSVFPTNIQHPTQKQRMTIRPNGMSKCCTSLYKSSQWRFTLGSPASNLLQWKQLKQRDDNC